MAGLLAWASLIAFPSHLRRDSGRSIQQREWKKESGKWDYPIHHLLFTIHHPYSYGDSTGLTPDFPFNPDY